MIVMPVLTEACIPDNTNGFTIGAHYRVMHTKNLAHTVINDNGHERCILLEGKSSHITVNTSHGMQRLVGMFIEVKG